MNAKMYYFKKTSIKLREYLDSDLFKFINSYKNESKYGDYLFDLRLRFYSLINYDLAENPINTYINILNFEKVKEYMLLAIKETNNHYLQMSEEIKKGMRL